jgi:hypothetical protein
MKAKKYFVVLFKRKERFDEAYPQYFIVFQDFIDPFFYLGNVTE